MPVILARFRAVTNRFVSRVIDVMSTTRAHSETFPRKTNAVPQKECKIWSWRLHGTSRINLALRPIEHRSSSLQSLSAVAPFIANKRSSCHHLIVTFPTVTLRLIVVTRITTSFSSIGCQRGWVWAIPSQSFLVWKLHVVVHFWCKIRVTAGSKTRTPQGEGECAGVQLPPPPVLYLTIRLWRVSMAFFDIIRQTLQDSTVHIGRYLSHT